MDKWRYYNHAMISMAAPHEKPDESPVESGQIWKNGKYRPLLARWTTDFDCDHETQWWYCIKDAPLDVAALKANRRYKITKGLRLFDVRLIDPRDYKEELYAVSAAALEGYPEKYRPVLNKLNFISALERSTYKIMGAFYRESNMLCGALYITEYDNYAILTMLKAIPEYEKFQVNAALIAFMLEHYKEKLQTGFYICDGERNISHETQFQDYLEKYFGFRKAYCRLHVAYRPAVKFTVSVMYPFRKLLKHTQSAFLYNMYCVLKMEEISRGFISKK